MSDSVSLFPQIRPSDVKTNRRVILGVIIVHILIVAVAITHTTQYKPLNIINPANEISAELTIVQPQEAVSLPVNHQTVTAPDILTSDTAERHVSLVKPAKTIVQDKPVTPPAVPAVKPLVKKVLRHPPRKIIPVHRQQVSKVSSEKTVQTENAKIADKNALPATVSGNMMKSAPKTDPRLVASVGCEVPAPEYPRRARRLQEQGQVLVRVIINAGGGLSHSEIARSSGFPDLDASALSAVAGIHCQPYIENGQAVPVITLQPVNFRLQSQ